VIWRTPKYTGPERRRRPRWRPKPFRVLLSLLALAAIGYAIAVLWLIGEETRIVSRAARTLPAERPAFSYEQIDIPRPDRARQFAWSMTAEGRDDGIWVLFLHGNAATIASNVSLSRYRVLRATGLNVLAPEYRGFAGLDGVATEASLSDDARAAYEYLRQTRRVPEARIVIYGWSLGAVVAADVALDVAPAAVILEAAPASLVDITQQRYPFFPIRLLMRRQFEAIATIDRVRAPLLFLHSPDDLVVPISEGRRLFGAARAEKEFIEVQGGHLDAPDVDAPRFSRAIERFLEAHAGVARHAASR
jgi:dipeptidyl aminopeptidase/acylaminoacyl peptidase